MSERVEEVTEMLSRIKRLSVAALLAGVVAVAIPVVSLAANVGGGP